MKEDINIYGNELVARFPLDRDLYWLLCEKGLPGVVDGYKGSWSIAQKIDRSYKGKEPDIAEPSISVPPDMVEELAKRLDVVWLWG